MIDKITESLTCKIRKKMPEIDDERAEVINFGLQILIGEIPKIFIMLFLAYILGVFKLTLLTFLILLPYKYRIHSINNRILFLNCNFVKKYCFN